MDASDLDTCIGGLGDLVEEVRRALLHLEIGRCDVDQLAAVKGHVSRVGNICAVAKTDIAVRADELRLADENDVVDSTLNPDGRESAQEEQTERERGGVLDNLPGLDDATRSGELSARYADIVAKAVANLTPSVRDEFYARHQNLAGLAATLSVASFRRHVAGLIERLLKDFGIDRPSRQRHQRKASTFTDLETGLWGISGRWDPLTGQKMNTALAAEINAIYGARRDDPTDLRTREQITADALTNLICGTALAKRDGAGGATVVMITDQQTAESGPHDRSVHEYGDGTSVAFDTLAALLTDATTTLVEATVNEHGVVQSLGDAVLDHGRNKRCAAPAQRLALRVMHRTCIFPGCDVPFDRCEQHHLIAWERHGRTDLVNLGPTCTRHHHQLHAHDWNLRFHPDTRDLTITCPDGTERTHAYSGLAPPGNDPPPGDHDPPALDDHDPPSPDAAA